MVTVQSQRERAGLQVLLSGESGNPGRLVNLPNIEGQEFWIPAFAGMTGWVGAVSNHLGQGQRRAALNSHRELSPSRRRGPTHRAIAFGNFGLNLGSLQVRGSRLRGNDVLSPNLKCDRPGAIQPASLALPARTPPASPALPGRRPTCWPRGCRRPFPP